MFILNMNYSVTAMQAVQFLGNCNGLETNVHNSWNCKNLAETYHAKMVLSYTHDVHDFDIHIFADEVDQVDHDKINGLYFSSLNKSLQYEHNTLW